MDAVGLSLLFGEGLAASIAGERAAHDRPHAGWLGSFVAGLAGAFEGATQLPLGPQVGGAYVVPGLVTALLFVVLVRLWGRTPRAAHAR